MFLSREKRIVEILLEKQQPVKIVELAVQLNVSKRTISNCITSLKANLPQCGVSLVSKPSTGIWLEFSGDNEQQFRERILNEECRDTDEDLRWTSIARHLLEVNEYKTVDDIAEENFLSSSAAYREIGKIEQFLKKYNIYLDRKTKRGIRAEGSETNIRIAKAELIKIGSENMTAKSLLDDLVDYFPLDLLHSIVASIQVIQQNNDISLSYISMKGLIIHLAITVNRVKKNKRIILDIKDLEHLSKQKEWNIALDLINELNNNLDLSLDQEECGYITIHLMGANLSMQVETSPAVKGIDPKLYEKIESIVRYISDKFSIPLIEDEYFLSVLFLHIKPMINRLKNGISLHNPFIGNIKEEHPLMFELSAEFSRKLNELFNVVLDDDEIGYIAMHFGGAFERARKQNLRTLKVILVCASGIGTIQFLKAKLENQFPEFEIVGEVSSYKLNLERNNLDHDFIIATIPLDIPGETVIYISPILSESDILKIRQKSKSLGATKTSKLAKLVHESISVFEASISNHTEAITVLSNLLQTNGYVDEDYKHSCLAREKLSSTYIGNMVAIPHAYHGHVLKQGIGVLVSKKPFDWNGSKTQLIFMLAIDLRSSQDFGDISYEIMNLINQVDLLDKLFQTKNYDEFKLYLK